MVRKKNIIPAMKITALAMLAKPSLMHSGETGKNDWCFLGGWYFRVGCLVGCCCVVLVGFGF
jgi:hypothetical protein